MKELTTVVENIKDSYEKLGLYLVDYAIATSDEEMVNAGESDEPTPDFRKKLADGEAMWVVQATFTIGKQAFTDRVLNPEKESLDTEFQMAMPSEIEIMKEKLRREGLAAFEPDSLTEEEGE